MKKIIVSIFFLLFFISCADISEEQKEDILTAQLFLTDGQCQDALNILDAMTDITTNARWYQTYASAQACFTSFNEITFFGTDIDTLDTTDDETSFRSMALFSTSDDMTSATDIDYANLYAAVNTLISAGGVTIYDWADRQEVFSSSDNTNISMQALYMVLAALGEYFFHFGNANTTTGAKGGGGAGNNCYMNYTAVAALAAVGGGTSGTCVGGGSGHADMTTALACNGIVLMNTMINIIPAISSSLPTDTGSLSDLDDNFAAFVTACNTALGVNNAVCTIVNQADCEALNTDYIETYMAALFENGHT